MWNIIKNVVMEEEIKVSEYENFESLQTKMCK
jgi:hypothetical protein